MRTFFSPGSSWLDRPGLISHNSSTLMDTAHLAEPAKRRFPDWLKKSFPEVTTVQTEEVLQKHGLNTICHSAKCPNRTECFAHKTATFMILGELCTRRCGFCSVPQGLPNGFVDWSEAERVAQGSLELGLRHVVVTSSTRDDLADEGSELFYKTILAIRRINPGATIEVLTPDFRGKKPAIHRVCEAKPEIYNHNLETVPRLYREVRPGAIYERSLQLIREVKTYDPGIITKSGLMVGLGETREEVLAVLRDFKAHGCDVVTIGQYLKPADGKLEAAEYIHPDLFAFYEREGLAMGLKQVFSGPFVRSSYHAEETFLHAKAVS